MAIVVENTDKDTEAVATGSFVFNLGWTPTDGRILIAFVGKDGTGGITPPASPGTWTQIQQESAGTSRCGVWWKEASSEGTSYTFTGASEPWAGVMYELSGVDTTTPIDISGISSDINNDTPISPTITTTVADTLIIAGFHHNSSGSGATMDGSLSNAIIEDSLNSSAACGLGMASKAQASIGATGTFTHSQSFARNWRAITIAIAPSASGPSIPVFMHHYRNLRG